MIRYCIRCREKQEFNLVKDFGRKGAFKDVRMFQCKVCSQGIMETKEGILKKRKAELERKLRGEQYYSKEGVSKWRKTRERKY